MKINKLLAMAIATAAFSQIALPSYANDINSLNNVSIEEEGEMNFSDVSPNHWAYRAIKKLVEEYGVIGGFPDGTFRGNRNLTRYEAAAMIAKVMEKVEEMSSGGTSSPSGVNQKALDRLKKEFMMELEDLQSEVKRLSKDQQDLQKDLDDTRDQVDMVKDMLPKVKIMGDATSRYEVVTNEFALDKFMVNSPQMRLRLGFMGEAMGGVTFGTRLVTSTANDITNQFIALGNLNSKLGVNLDTLYVGIRPWNGALDLTLGRHANPFIRTTELVWDNDVTLDGAYLGLRFGSMDNHLGLLGAVHGFNLTGLNVAQRPNGGNWAGADSSNMASAGAHVKFGGEAWMFKLGANYHSLMNVNNLVDKSLSLNPMTNLTATVDGKKQFVSDYNLVTGALKLQLFKNAYLPLSVFGDVSYNLGAGMRGSDAEMSKAKSNALGFVAGASLGKLEDAGNIMATYKYKSVGYDSVFSAFIEDQLAGTNRVAHEVDLGIQIAPMTSLMFTGQMADKIADKAAGDVPGYTLRGYVMHKF